MASAKQQQDIVVQISKNFDNADVSIPNLKKLVKAICNRFNLSKATVSIVIVDDAQIRKLNAQFLKHNRACDCLSFDLSDYKNHKSQITNRKLFELVVNGQTAVRQARLRGHSSEAELALYITHGLLHKLGFDDSTQSQAGEMHKTEDEILRQFGYGLVYNKNIKAQKQKRIRGS